MTIQYGTASFFIFSTVRPKGLFITVKGKQSSSAYDGQDS